MTKDPLVYVGHILDAIGNIQEDLHGFDFERLCAERVVRQAFERNLENISEASRRIPEELKAAEAEIPWKDIAGIGNVLRHGYDEVDLEELWKTFKEDLDPLKAAVKRIEGKCK